MRKRSPFDGYSNQMGFLCELLFVVKYNDQWTYTRTHTRPFIVFFLLGDNSNIILHFCTAINYTLDKTIMTSLMYDFMVAVIVDDNKYDCLSIRSIE